eukprot:3246342-Pyramimonas_sp.AAC.1
MQLWGPRRSQLRCSSHCRLRHSRESHFGGALRGGSATFARDFSQLKVQGCPGQRCSDRSPLETSSRG